MARAQKKCLGLTTCRQFQAETVLIDTAGLDEEGRQARCQILPLFMERLLSADENEPSSATQRGSLPNCWAPGIHKAPIDIPGALLAISLLLIFFSSHSLGTPKPIHIKKH